MKSLLKISVVVLFLAGCFEPIPGGPKSGYETDELSCSDGRDNDQDGRVDCEDTDCLQRNFCAEIIPLHPPTIKHEDTIESCTDGIDNDEDGQFDCGDRDCSAISELCCSGEFTDAACSDGIDNDGNGFADCADFNCRNGKFTKVCDRELICDDGVDNDEDGEVDEEDLDCQIEWKPGECSDGIDNDGNGFVDTDDPGCSPALEEACGDGKDNDLNGYTDGEDPACGGGEPEDTRAKCDDGIDNDRDGEVDCRDVSCFGDFAMPAVRDFCRDKLREIEENTAEECSDGIDNDGDGFTDCRDFSCQSEDDFATPEAVALCMAAEKEDTLDRCRDGIDNDGNGFVDCDDNSCADLIEDTLLPGSGASNEERAIANELLVSCELSLEACTDGIDNDGNGFVDCSDNSCRRLGTVFRRDPQDPRSPIIAFQGNCTESGTFPGDIIFPETVAKAIEFCSNGIDEDADGFVDCEDFDCQWNPALNPRATDPRSTEPSYCETEGERLLCI